MHESFLNLCLNAYPQSVEGMSMQNSWFLRHVLNPQLTKCGIFTYSVTADLSKKINWTMWKTMSHNMVCIQYLLIFFFLVFYTVFVVQWKLQIRLLLHLRCIKFYYDDVILTSIAIKYLPSSFAGGFNERWKLMSL